jgi:hypothetical protein
VQLLEIEVAEMTAELQRCRAAQTAHATLLLAGHPEQRGLRQALADQFAEDLILSGLWLTERPDSAHTEQDGAV